MQAWPAGSNWDVLWPEAAAATMLAKAGVGWALAAAVRKHVQPGS